MHLPCLQPPPPSPPSMAASARHSSRRARRLRRVRRHSPPPTKLPPLRGSWWQTTGRSAHSGDSWLHASGASEAEEARRSPPGQTPTAGLLEEGTLTGTEGEEGGGDGGVGAAASVVLGPILTAHTREWMQGGMSSSSNLSRDSGEGRDGGESVCATAQQ